MWGLPLEGSWLTLVGVLGHAYIATGLTAATFVFYRERMGLLAAARKAAQVRAGRSK